MAAKQSGYDLSRSWFDFAFENPDQVSPNDTALFLWFVELNNRLGWADKFGITSKECMAAVGFKTYPPYRNALKKLIELGFVKLIRESKNQYQCNIIALSKNNKATTKALDKAHLKQPIKHLSYSLNTETTKQCVGADKNLRVIPSLDDVKKYFIENGYSEALAEKAFKHYDLASWKDTKGNPVLNWKQKMHTVWFKDDGKSPQAKKATLNH